MEGYEIHTDENFLNPINSDNGFLSNGIALDLKTGELSIDNVVRQELEAEDYLGSMILDLTFADWAEKHEVIIEHHRAFKINGQYFVWLGLEESLVDRLITYGKANLSILEDFVVFEPDDDQRYEYHVDKVLVDIDIVRETCKRYVLVPVTTKEAESQKRMKTVHAIYMQDMAFVCLTQDEDTLHSIQQRLCDPDITAAAFLTETGDYEPLYVRYGQPSFRSGGQWYRVQWRDPRTGRFIKS